MWPPDTLPKPRAWQEAALRALFPAPDAVPDAFTRAALDRAAAFLEATPYFVCRRLPLSGLSAVPAFLQSPPYAPLQAHVDRAEFFAATLGPEVDRKLKALSITHIAEAVVWNAAANAYLEACVEAQCQAGQVLFCPGYSGTPHTDILPILEILDAARYLGIHPTPSALMVPEKSVCGLLVYDYAFTCKGCLLAARCPHLKAHTRCYRNP